MCIATTLYARDVCARGVVRERDNLRIYSSVKCRQLDDAEYHISETLQPRCGDIICHTHNCTRL